MLQLIERQAREYYSRMMDQKQRLCKQNNPSSTQTYIYLIANFIKNEPDKILLQYERQIHNPTFNKPIFLTVLSEMTEHYRDDPQRQLQLTNSLQIIENILNKQRNIQKYKSLFSADIFTNAMHINSITYQKKLCRYYAKQNLQMNRHKIWEQSTRGYSQILLFIVEGLRKQYFDGEAMMARVFDIVGRYDLDMDRVMDIVMENICEVGHGLAFLEMVMKFNKENCLVLLCNKLFKKNQPKVELMSDLTIDELMHQTTDNLYYKQQYCYCPKYLKQARILIVNHIFSIEQFRPFMFQFSAEQVLAFEERRLVAGLQKINQTQILKNSNRSKDEEQKEQKYERQVFIGQAFKCFKFALLHQHLKSNDFANFKKGIQQLTGNNKIDLIIHVPIIKTLCQTIQYIIDPLFKNLSVGVYFKSYKQQSNSLLPDGYFKPTFDKQALLINLQQIFAYLGIYIGFSIQAFVKLCRLLKKILQVRLVVRSYQERFGIIKQMTGNIISNYLIGAVCLQENSVVMSNQLFGVMQSFTQLERFQFYLNFMQNVLFSNPYLCYLYHKTSIKLNGILNKVSLQTQKSDISKINRMLYSQFVLVSHQFIRRVVLLIFQKSLNFTIQCFRTVPTIAKQYMLFLCMNYIANNQQILIDINGQSSDNFKLISTFILKLIQQNSSLQFMSLLQMAISQMNVQYFQTSFQQYLGYNQLLMFLLQQIFPDTNNGERFGKKMDFFTFGYYLQLQCCDLITKFDEARVMRAKFWNYLITEYSDKNRTDKPDKIKNLSSSQVSNSSAVQPTPGSNNYILKLFKLLNIRLKNIMKFNHLYDLQTTGILIDECTQWMMHLTRFFTYQINLMRQCEKKDKPDTETQDYSSIFNQYSFNQLLMDQCPLHFACSLFKAVTKLDFYSSSCKTKLAMRRSMGNDWLSRSILSPQQKLNIKLQYIEQSKVIAFQKSDFFFNFWFSSNDQLILLQKKYQQKIQQLRRILNKKDLYRVDDGYDGIDMQQSCKQRYLLAYRMIEMEKTDIAYHYQKYNFAAVTILQNNYSQRAQKISKFTLPNQYKIQSKVTVPQLKIGQDKKFKEFVSLLFGSCILPRMMVDPSEAVFCAKFVLRVIIQNKIPSNKSILLLFWLLQASFSYVPFSTRRQAQKCLPHFISELLRVFQKWNDFASFSLDLQREINMQKFNDKKYETLKQFLLDFIFKITSGLISIKTEPYLIKNVLHLIDRIELFPFTKEQGEQLLAYIKNLIQICKRKPELEALKIHTDLIGSKLQSRMRQANSMKGIILSRQFKRTQLRHFQPTFKPNRVIINIDDDDDTPKEVKAKREYSQY